MMYLTNDPRNYNKPTAKALAMAQQLKSAQRMTAERYQEFYEKPAPAWMSASAEDIARHIDLVHWAAVQNGVQLKWEHVPYGLPFDEIVEIALAKKSHEYRIGDYLPREADTVITVNGCQIRNYFGVYYIARHDMACGVYQDDQGDYRLTGDNLTRQHIIGVRFGTLEEAIHLASKIAQ